MLTPHMSFTTPPITGYVECAHIVDEKRRTVCEIVQFADALIADTVLVFLSDNGGSTGSGRGQNLPLHGRKSSNFECGIRTVSFVFGG